MTNNSDHDHDATEDVPRDLTSIGKLSEQLQQPADVCRLAARDAGVIPSVRINAVEFYDRAAVSRITAFIEGTAMAELHDRRHRLQF